MSENREDFNEKIEEYKRITEPSKSELGMKWFKFLINFLLFSSAADYLTQGISMIFNFQNEFIQELYDLKYFGGDMRAVGVVFGIMWLIPAATSVYIRFELAGFKKGAPKKFIILVTATQALTLANELFVKLSELFFVDTIRFVVGTVIGVTLACVVAGFIFIHPNIVYFQKREHLFVN